MPYAIEWLQPDHILFVRFIGNVTIDDADRLDQQLNAYLTRAPDRLHLLFDFGDATAVSMNIYQVDETTTYMRQEKLGWISVVGIRNRFAKMMYSVVTQLARVETHFYKDYDEAMDFLAGNLYFPD